MSVLKLTTDIEAPAERCFDLSRDIDVHAGSMVASRERAVAGVTSGLIGLGQEVTWKAQHFGIRWRVTSRITEFDRPSRFVDEMRRGPFASFRHEHHFEQNGAMTTMVDVVDYRLPLGPIGVIADAVLVGRYLRHLLEVRNRYIKQAAER
jgi:ligand-binding SRPBCC domain-containing protein